MGHVEQHSEVSGEKLTLAELGQLTRDIVMGHPTSVVLDTPVKFQVFLKLRADIERAKQRGYMIETPN